MSGTLMVVGGGKMGEALVAGLVRTGWTPAQQIVVVEQYAPRRSELTQSYDGLRVAATMAEAAGALATPPEGAVIAVKPGDVEPVCRELAAAGDIRRVLSIAAGVTLSSLEAWLSPPAGAAPAVVRAMPNTPALVGAGASAISAGTHAEPADLEWAHGILAAVGQVVELPESSLDAVTGLSGSGPAYVFLFAEALIDAGVLVGLTRQVAKQLAVQTLLGAARLLDETGDEPSTLRAAVTSPGGTTAAGLRALEAAKLRSAVIDAVSAAAARAREMGGPPPAP